jgi:hypothetical protein
MMTSKKQTAVEFFYEHAGYSYDPKTQTEAEGRREGALALVKAELWAAGEGISFEWSVDELDSGEWSDDPEPWQQWVCVARDIDGSVRASLGGIDFGRDGDPYNSPYRRVVQAELALEAMTAE